MLKQMNRLKLSSKFSFFALHHLERFWRSGNKMIIFIFNKKDERHVRDKRDKYFAYSRVGNSVYDATRVRFLCEVIIFFVLLHYFTLFFVKSFLLILRTILSRSQSARELMNYANYEYVIFTLKECISQNLFEIMCG